MYKANVLALVVSLKTITSIYKSRYERNTYSYRSLNVQENIVFNYKNNSSLKKYCFSHKTRTL